VAHLPPAAGQQTYDLSLKVNLAVAHDHLGLPFKRIESFQQLAGMPLPDATQWEQVEQVADSAYPIYGHLERLGPQQPLVYQDDTGARILSPIGENQADPQPERKGMYTTSCASRGSTQSVCTSPGASTRGRISTISWPIATRVSRPSWPPRGCRSTIESAARVPRADG